LCVADALSEEEEEEEEEEECSVEVEVEVGVGEDSPQPPIGRIVSIGPAKENNSMRCRSFLVQ
jgi:hypothetical protein